MGTRRNKRTARNTQHEPDRFKRSNGQHKFHEPLSEAEILVCKSTESGSECTFLTHRPPSFALLFQTNEYYRHPTTYFQKLIEDEYASFVQNANLTELEIAMQAYSYTKFNTLLNPATPSLMHLCTNTVWKKIPTRRHAETDRYFAIVPIANAFKLTAYEPLNTEFICWLGLAHSGANRGFQIPRRSERKYHNSPDLHQNLAALRIRGAFLSKYIRSLIGIRGIYISGSWIDGDIDLIEADLHFPLHITQSIVSGNFLGFGASFVHLNLQSTSLFSFKADGCTIRRGLFLRKGFVATKGVRLVSAHINGSIDLGESTIFAGDDEIALFIAYTNVAGTVHINDCQIHGTSQLNDMRVARNIDFQGTHIFTNSFAILFDAIEVGGSIKLGEMFKCTGPIQLNRARIARDLDLTGGIFSSNDYSEFALIVDGSRIDGILFVRGAKLTKGAMNFAYSHSNVLSDLDLSAWMQATKLRLDGFTYDRIDGEIDTTKRVKWLDKIENHDDINFFAQPWEQLSNTLYILGYKKEATLVSIEKENRRGRGRIIPNFTRRLWHHIFGWIAGYGYEPFRVVKFILATWLLSSLVYLWADQQAAFGPSNALIFTNESIVRDCGWTTPGTIKTKIRWTVCGSLPQEYTTFNNLIYSLDLILPLVDLQQDRDWAPIVTEPDGVTIFIPGMIARFVMWLEIILGWFLSLILVAALSGLSRTPTSK